MDGLTAEDALLGVLEDIEHLKAMLKKQPYANPEVVTAVRGIEALVSLRLRKLNERVAA